ncbi:hypothetical protein JCM10207_001395 [Rhodosporidiobolus poonsookiae]
MESAALAHGSVGFELLGQLPGVITRGVESNAVWTHQKSTRFPDLNITNQPYALGGTPGINSNYTLTEGAGEVIQFTWDEPGKVVGYDDLYMTSKVAGEAKYAAFIAQLNVTYSPLQNISMDNSTGVWSGWAAVPNDTVFPPQPQVVNSAFVSLVDEDIFLTPYNVSLINNHTVAGPAIWQAS